MHVFLSFLGGMAGGIIGVFMLFKVADWLDRRKE